MKFKYYNIFWVFLSAVFLILVFTSVDVDEKKLDDFIHSSKKSEETKNGLIKSFDSQGTLKTAITYLNGEKHGKSYSYYRDGKSVQLEMVYAHGKRHGISKKYFESGELYAETSYNNDLIDGTRKIYFQNGKIKALVPYRQGLPGVGLEEYLLNGSKKEQPMIEYHQEANRLFLTTSKPCRDLKFYVGKLIDDQFFTFFSEDLELIQEDNGDLFIDLETYTPSYLQFQDIVCACKTLQGNPLILKERISTSSLKKVN
jgi:antitoxin component YwqK of YwqJK toxin-antitoxin module